MLVAFGLHTRKHLPLRRLRHPGLTGQCLPVPYSRRARACPSTTDCAPVPTSGYAHSAYALSTRLVRAFDTPSLWCAGRREEGEGGVARNLQLCVALVAADERKEAGVHDLARNLACATAQQCPQAHRCNAYIYHGQAAPAWASEAAARTAPVGRAVPSYRWAHGEYVAWLLPCLRASSAKVTRPRSRSAV